MKKERLLMIPGLSLAGVIGDMGDEQLDSYVQKLRSYVDCFQEQERDLRLALKQRDLNFLKTILSDIKSALIGIHARDLANSAVKQLAELDAVAFEKAEVSVTALLTSLSTLSIDIQMMEYDAGEAGKAGKAPEDNAGTAADDNKAVDILVVDDKAFFLQSLRQILQGTNYKAAYVASGRDALAFLNSHTPKLFILDILMPNMDGYELAGQIRKKGQKAPIIFLTGNSTKEYVVNAVKAGGVDFIVKPVNKDSVLSRIKKYVPDPEPDQSQDPAQSE